MKRLVGKKVTAILFNPEKDLMVFDCGGEMLTTGGARHHPWIYGHQVLYRAR